MEVRYSADVCRLTLQQCAALSKRVLEGTLDSAVAGTIRDLDEYNPELVVAASAMVKREPFRRVEDLHRLFAAINRRAPRDVFQLHRDFFDENIGSQRIVCWRGWVAGTNTQITRVETSEPMGRSSMGGLSFVVDEHRMQMPAYDEFQIADVSGIDHVGWHNWDGSRFFWVWSRLGLTGTLELIGRMSPDFAAELPEELQLLPVPLSA